MSAISNQARLQSAPEPELSDLSKLVGDPRRLAAVRRTCLLDTPAEDAFDRLTALAARSLNVPVALISLLDGDRHFFKSAVGLPEPWASRRERPLDAGFCQFAVALRQPLVIPDTAVDARVQSHPAVLEFGIGAYLGVPLINSEGQGIGTFCIFDTRPRAWSEVQVALVQDLAASVMTEIELRTEVRERRRAEALVSEQNRVLEMVATGASLSAVLDALVRSIEKQSDGARCAILLASADGRTLETGAAPNLPAAYNAALGAIPVCATFGPCSTAAHLHEQIVMPDIAADDRWPAFTQLATTHGLRACWSTPIPGSKGEVLGTFAMYYDKPCTPGENDRRLIGIATHLAAIAIEHKRVEKERAQLLAAEKQAREATEAASSAKDEFLAMLGHELRNPLSPILTACQLMRMNDATQFQREREIIERQVSHMTRLVDDLLDVSRIVRGKIELRCRPVELSQVISGAVELAMPLIELKNIRLDLDVPQPPPIVYGDPTRLAQVISNLLTNAAKFSEEGSTVYVTGRSTVGAVHISVRDQGQGIDPDLLPVIFDLFVQGRQSLDRSKGGLGLGLGIVKNLVCLHGGTIEARSEGRGRGSTFTVRLPAAPREVTPAQLDMSVVAHAETGRRRVLLVDDNVDAVLLLTRALQERGLEVRCAYDGPSALALLEEFEPHVALLDIGLPLMDGFELARRIRAKTLGRDIAIIGISGYGRPQDRERAKDCGFDQYLVKPVDMDALEHALQPQNYSGA